MEQIWQVSWMQGKLTEGQPVGWKVDRRFPILMKSWRKFTINPADALKVNWCWQKVRRPQLDYRRWKLPEDVWTQRKLTEYLRPHVRLTDARKVNNSWQKHPRSRRKLTEGDRRCNSRSECQQKVQRMFKSWRKILLQYVKVHVSLQKVWQTHKKWSEYPADALKLNGRYYRCTESWRKFTEGPADTMIVGTIPQDVWKVNGSLWTHVKLT